MNHTLKFYKYRIKKKAGLLNQPRPLQDYFLPMLSGGKTSILDVGAGPFTTVGNLNPQVSITACDLYAFEYAQMIYDAEIIPLVITEKQNMEKMAYGNESFGIVHCENALDHTENAIRAVDEMTRVAEGWVYLKHFPNVGERNHYKGLHRWNLSEDGTLWNKEKSVSLSEWGFKTWKEGRMVVSRLEK